MEVDSTAKDTKDIKENPMASPITDYALIDPRLVADTYLLHRAAEPPALRQAEPVLAPGQTYGTVLPPATAGEPWRMYYLRGAHYADAEHQTDRYRYLERLALSGDGVTWERPTLGLVEFDGTRANNIVMAHRYVDAAGRDLTGASGPEGFCVLDARRTAVPHARGRFTAMFLASPSDRWSGIGLAHSDDGLRWTGYAENPLIPGWHDTQTVCFYDARTSRYVMYLRPPLYAGPRSANRKVARCESADLLHWTTPEVVLDTDDRDAPAEHVCPEGSLPHPRGRARQFYGMTVFPYQQVYVGLGWMYDVPSGRMWVELLHSFDGCDWRREAERAPWLNAGVPAGLTGQMFITAANPPIIVGDELWLYATATQSNHHEKAPPSQGREQGIMLLALPRDRWVGYHGDAFAGQLLTRPLDWEVGRLWLNARIAAGGEVQVAFCDELGQPLTALGLDTIAPLVGPLDSVRLPVTYAPPKTAGGAKSVFRFPTRGPVRLRLSLKHATVFGFSFGE